MKTNHLNNVELRSLAWRILIKHLGYSGALRFALQTQPGDGDYSERRHRMLGALSVDALVKRMHRTQSRPGSRRARR